nr:PREDICTED: cysteine proteinase 15A-like [Bemisia tabaci]
MFCQAVLVLLVSNCILQGTTESTEETSSLEYDINDGLMMIDTSNDEQVMAKFAEFKNIFTRDYADAAEEEKRFKIFKDNLIKVQKLNANPNDDAIYGINAFFDLTPEEMRMRTGLRPPQPKT